jgi:hypothetical protein
MWSHVVQIDIHMVLDHIGFEHASLARYLAGSSRGLLSGQKGTIQEKY